MKDRKTELKYFTIPEWKKEQDYLRRQHNTGWKLARVSGLCCYHFVRCSPEDVIYQLDYNPQGRACKAEYTQMFTDCGWEYIQDYVGYSYFRKPASEMEGEEEIFCDDASRLDMMKRVFKGRVIPLLAIFFLIILPNLYVQRHIHTSLSAALSIAFIGLFLVYILLFLQFGYQFWKYWKSLQ